MTDLSTEDIVFIIGLLDESESDGDTREKFLTIVSSELDARGYEGERRAAVVEFARKRAENSSVLASNLADLAKIEHSRRILRNCGTLLDRADWRKVVSQSWPSPIAHEVERLIEELRGRRLPSGARLDPSTDSVLLQLRDTFEVLIKFTTVLIMRALAEADGDAADWVRREMFRPLQLGQWVGNLRESLKRATSPGIVLPEAILKLTTPARGRLYPMADGYSSVRNDTIGHGAHALDPGDTAAIVLGCLETGEIKNLKGEKKKIPPLTRVLSHMVAEFAFAGISLVATLDEGEVELSGAGAAESWLADERHSKHSGQTMPIFARLASGERLALGPFMAARTCTQCERRDVLVFDSLYEAKKGGTFDLLDFARGHKSRMTAHAVPDLSEGLGDLVPEDATDLRGESTSFDYVLEALDKARVDRNYRSPTYLRKDLAAFMRDHDRGVFWLQAPAHVGKTTFVQGLTDLERGDEPIDPRFDAQDGGKLVAYYCRKEYRTGLGGMLAQLERVLEKAYRVSDNVRMDRPAAPPVVKDGTPQAFVNWLAAWRKFSEDKRLVRPGAPLVLAIDGLDEADPPTESSPLQVLPPRELLPSGLYLVLTSRPVGAEDSPEFLSSHVGRLYGAS